MLIIVSRPVLYYRVLLSFMYLYVHTVQFFVVVFFFFKQKTAYEMRISDWSSDVCSSDLGRGGSRTVPTACSRHSRWTRTIRCCTTTCGSCLPGSEIGRASCRERVCQYV